METLTQKSQTFVEEGRLRMMEDFNKLVLSMQVDCEGLLDAAIFLSLGPPLSTC
jgi:hypothetical protein